MWANAQRDVRPVEYMWRPLFNAAEETTGQKYNGFITLGHPTKLQLASRLGSV